MTSIRHIRSGFGSNRLWNSLSKLAGIGAFVAQTTSGDLSLVQNSGQWNQWSGQNKFQYIVHNLVARLTLGNVNVFSQFGGAPSPTFNPANILNKWTGLGIAAMIYKHLPGVPQKGKVGKFGFPLILAGVVGGLLDDPISGAARVNPSGLNVSTTAAFSGAVTGGGGAWVGAITRSVSGVYPYSSGLNNR